MTTRTKQSAATKAKKEAQAKAEATEAKAEPVPETQTPVDAVAPNAEQEAQASSEATEAKAEQVPEAPTPVDAVAPNPEPAAAHQLTEIQGNTVTGDGTGNALPPMFELPGVFVRTKRRFKSRRRAGFRFSREGMGIALEALSEEQLQQLRDDPALEVEDCTFPLDEATSEPEA